VTCSAASSHDEGPIPELHAGGACGSGRCARLGEDLGRAFVNEMGSPGLGTSGSGDVLAGVIAGLFAPGASADQSAVWAVHLHAQAGERLSRRMGRPNAIGFLARELPGEVPEVMARLAAQRRQGSG